MKRKLTPQEKKIRDYENHRRNAYGANDKNSRNAIRKRKRWVIKAYRKKVNNLTSSKFKDAEDLEDTVSSVKKHGWRKYPDALLFEQLDHKWSGSSRTVRKPHKSKLRDQALKRLKKSKTLRLG